jgi:hypothetical protein
MNFGVVAGGQYVVKGLVILSGNNSTTDYKFSFRVQADGATPSMRGIGNGLRYDGTVAPPPFSLTATASKTEDRVSQILNMTGTVNTDPIPVGAGIQTIFYTYAFYAVNDATFSYCFALNSTAGFTASTMKGSMMEWKRIDI